MGVEALHTGIEFEMLAFLGASESHQPIKKLTAESSGSIFCAGDEIVDIKKSPREKRLRKPVAGNGTYFTSCLQVNNAIAIFLLALHVLDELVRRGEMRTQLAHYRITGRDLLRAFRFGNRRLGYLGSVSACDDFSRYAERLSRRPSYQRSSLARDCAERLPPNAIAKVRERI